MVAARGMLTDGRNRWTVGAACLLVLGQLTCGAGLGESLMANGGFEEGTRGWESHGTVPRFAVVPRPGGQGSVLHYTKTAGTGSPAENAHFDQVVPVEPQGLYVAAIKVRSAGGLQPVLRIADMAWGTLVAGQSKGSREWEEVKVLFRSGGEANVRFQVFGGSRGEIRETFPGESWFDDAFLRPAKAEERAAYLTCRVAVDPGRVVGRVNPLFFGANMLFMIDDDAALRGGAIADHLRAMPCRLLRFPGGDVADNYLWRTHSLDNPTWWPSKQGAQTTDTEEFMAFCRQVGSEPILVVNLEACLVHGDLDAGAREAAAWVRHCNREHDYRVRFWEIGNETYLYSPGKHKRVPVSAGRYAEAYVRFSAAMKAVDPSVRTGAVGPFRPAQVVNLGDRKDDGSWWSTVVAAAGDRLDFVVVHEYHPAALERRTPRAQAVRDLRAFLSDRLPGRHVPIALTEWNLNKNSTVSVAEMAPLLAERAGEYLLGGVDMATFWPLRIGGKPWGARGLLSLGTREPQVPYQVLRLLSSRLGGGADLVETRSDRPFVYSFAGTDREGSVQLFLCNFSTEPEGIGIQADVIAEGYGSAEATTLSASERGATPVWGTPAVLRSGSHWTLRLPPYSLSAVRFRR